MHPDPIILLFVAFCVSLMAAGLILSAARRDPVVEAAREEITAAVLENGTLALASAPDLMLVERFDDRALEHRVTGIVLGAVAVILVLIYVIHF